MKEIDHLSEGAKAMMLDLLVLVGRGIWCNQSVALGNVTLEVLAN